MNFIDGGVTSAKGFSAANCNAKIKYMNRDDMAMIFCDVPCSVAGTFTKNVVKAAPVLWDKKVCVEEKKAQAVVINAGIANACTGEEGFFYCKKTADKCAEVLSVNPAQVLVASTGVIGMQLPMDCIENGIEMMSKTLSKERSAGEMASKAIMTTDTKNKEVAVEVVLSGKTVTIGGMCKGSGMIHPNMCTMLSFVTTDVNITPELLQEALSYVVEDTYNMISVDGDTSTNDTCLVLASGLAKNPKITEKNKDYDAFVEALFEANKVLAMKMAGDGEGATALFEVKVENAVSKEEAKILAKSVVTSSLTKAAIYGHDANWGRILCAMGYSGVDFDPEKVDLYFESEGGKLQIAKGGVSTGYSEEEATKILSFDKVTAICDMHQKDASATAWGCDLTHEYVSINADYRS